MGIGLVEDYMHVSIDMSILAHDIVINYVLFCYFRNNIYNHICTSHQFTSIITHGGCWENMIKVCKSQAKAE